MALLVERPQFLSSEPTADLSFHPRLLQLCKRHFLSISDVREGLFYTRDHLWVCVQGRRVTIGITDYAQAQLQSIIIVDPLWATAGYAFSSQEAMLMIDAVVKTVSIYAPVDGTVVAINSRMQVSPEVINSDPYGEGWLIKLQLNRPLITGRFMTAGHYRHFIR